MESPVSGIHCPGLHAQLIGADHVADVSPNCDRNVDLRTDASTSNDCRDSYAMADQLGADVTRNSVFATSKYEATAQRPPPTADALQLDSVTSASSAYELLISASAPPLPRTPDVAQWSRVALLSHKPATHSVSRAENVSTIRGMGPRVLRVCDAARRRAGEKTGSIACWRTSCGYAHGTSKRVHAASDTAREISKAHACICVPLRGNCTTVCTLCARRLAAHERRI